VEPLLDRDAYSAPWLMTNPVRWCTTSPPTDTSTS